MDRQTKKLLKKLEKGEGKEKYSAMSSLGKLDDPEILQRLIDELRSAESATERYQIIIALGRTGNPVFIDPLDSIANLDPDMKIRDVAYKAVRTLEILEERREEKRRQQIGIEGEADSGIEWKSLAAERLLQNRDTTGGQSADWSYAKAKRIEQEEEAKRRRESEETEQERKERLLRERQEAEKRRIRQRRPFRIFLMIVTVIILTFAVLLAWYFIVVEPAPDDRAGIVTDLDEWSGSQYAIVQAYQEQLVQDPINCDAIRDIDTPQRARWTELVEGIDNITPQPSGGRFGDLADDMSRVDEADIQDFRLILSALGEAELNLSQIRQKSREACDGRDELPNAEWPEWADVAILSDATFQLTQATELIIAQEREELPAETRLELLQDFELWLNLQKESLAAYEVQLANDPLTCPPLLEIGVPPKPRRLEIVDTATDAFAGLDVVMDALDQANNNLLILQRSVQSSCQGRDTLPQSEWSAYSRALESRETASLFIESVESVVQSELRQAAPPEPTAPPEPAEATPAE